MSAGESGRVNATAVLIVVLAACVLAFPCADAAAQTAPSWPSLTVAPKVAPDATKDAAVIIGIDEYVFVPHVAGATDNAREWFTFLVEGEKLPVSRAHLLRNRDGSREQILATAKQAANEVEPGGTLWVVFVGHGAPSADGKDGILVGVDAQQSASSLYARSVSQTELLNAIAGPQARSIVVLDACFSGRTATGAAIAPGLQPLLPVVDAALPRNVSVLSAGTSDQFAGPLPGANRPAFSYLVLGGLRGWADKASAGLVTAQDAIDYARVALTVLPIGRSQTPQLHAADGNAELSHGGTEKGPSIESAVAGAELPVVDTSTPANAAEAGGPGHIRVRATCGNDPRLLGARAGLAVFEVTDARDIPLKPSSDASPHLRYDDATHQRIMTDPDFVDYTLPAGPQRLRVASTRCHSDEERVVIPAGKTVEFAPHLELIAPPVDFRRPELASPSDRVQLLDADGQVLCKDLPCKHDVPVQSGYRVVWARDSGVLEARVPDTVDVGAGQSAALDAKYARKRSSATWPIIAIGGAVATTGVVVYFAQRSSCTETYYDNGAYRSGLVCNEQSVGSPTAQTTTKGRLDEIAVPTMAVGGALIAVGVALLTGAFGHDELTLGAESTVVGHVPHPVPPCERP